MQNLRSERIVNYKGNLVKLRFIYSGFTKDGKYHGLGRLMASVSDLNIFEG